MKKRIAKKWVKALRSGEYLQTKHTLHKNHCGVDRFCCLGVLTNLYVEETGNTQVWGNNGKLDYAVRNWAGIKTFYGRYTYKKSEEYNYENDLIGLNDDGKDFNYIADVIEEYQDEL